MNKKNLMQVFSLTMSFQLMVTPVLAANNGQPSNSGANFANLVNTIAQPVASMIWGSPSNGVGNYANGLQSQMTPIADKYFTPATLGALSQPAPGFQGYLGANGKQFLCATLNTSLTYVEPEVCKSGVMSTMGDPNQQLADLKGYSDLFSGIRDKYDNSLLQSNQGYDMNERTGLGCMKDSVSALDGYFQSRLNELTELSTTVDRLTDSFVQQSQKDLEAIGEMTAILDGDSSDIAKEARTRKPELFDSSKIFNNPACASIQDANTFGNKGKSRGLNGINSELQTMLNTKDGYSGASFEASYGNVVNDINILASSMSKSIKNDFAGFLANPSAFLNGQKSNLNMSTGVNMSLNATLYQDVVSNITTEKNNLAASAALLAKEDSSLVDLAKNINGGSEESQLRLFNQSLTNLENKIKNECLTRNIGDLDMALSKVSRAGISKHANNEGTNVYKSEVKKVLTDPKLSLEQKQERLAQVESKYGSGLIIERNHDQVVGDTTIKATNNSTSQFFTAAIANCDAQFKTNKLGSGYSGAEVIGQLKNLRQGYKTLAAKASSDIEKDIKNKMINCASSEIANSSVGGSCSSASFNPKTAGFCANAALSCSKNMKACSQQSQALVEKYKKDRADRISTYKKNIAGPRDDGQPSLKQAIKGNFENALAIMKAQSAGLNQAFNIGFTDPEYAKDVPENERYLEKYKNAGEEQMLLEDPAKYAEMFKNNIKNLKASVQKQQDGVKKVLQDHIRNTQDNYKKAADVAANMANVCSEKMMAYKGAQEQMAQEMAKKQSELGEKNAQACELVNSLRNNPKAGCSENLDDLTGAFSSYKLSLRSWCSDNNFSSSTEKSSASATSVCYEYSKNKGKPAYASLVNFCSDDGLMLDTKCSQHLSTPVPAAQASNTTPATTPVTTVNNNYQKCLEGLEAAVLVRYQDVKVNINAGSMDAPEAPAVCSDNSQRGEMPWESGDRGLANILPQVRGR
jgi:hypothetical protein